MPVGMGQSSVKGVVKKVTRVCTEANGDVSYSGFGFQPVVVALIAHKGAQCSWGFDDVSERSDVYDINATGMSWDPGYSISLNDGSGNIQNGFCKTFDADGITIQWSKSGNPTGTANILILAIG
jgi:hypothetical protein